MVTRAKLIASLWALSAFLPALTRAGEPLTYGKVDAMNEALNTQSCLACNYDGNPRSNDSEAVAIGVRVGGKRSALKQNVANARSLVKKTLGNFSFKLDGTPAKPEYGPLKNNPDAEKKPDQNRWNPAIEGANGAVFFGLIGMILGGPVGLVIAAVAGFILAYTARQYNDR